MVTERTVLVRLKAEVNDFVRGMGTAAAAVKGLSHEINTTNERTAWMAQGFLALAPALVPIGAVAVPAVTTLATQLGLAAAAAGVGILAFQGVSSSLKALNTYQLEPTSANLAAMQLQMEKIGPTGEQFVRFLDSLAPQFNTLQETARGGLFPGLESGIQSMMTRLPEVRNIVGQIATAMGDLASGAGDALAGPKFNDFFDFLKRQARPLLEDMGHTIGNFIDGLAAMASAFEPLTVTFSHGFLSMSQAFASWAHGLSASEGFTHFIAYATENLPKVVDFLASTANAFVQLAQAAAPVGTVMLPLLTNMLKTVSALADTPLGSVFIALAAAMSLYGRAAALASITTAGAVPRFLRLEGGLVMTTKAAWLNRDAMLAVTTAQERASLSAVKLTELEGQRAASARAGVGALAQGAVAAGLLAVSLTGLDNKLGVTNTVMGTFLGLMAGGPIGAGVGLTIGAIVDLTHANDDLDAAVTRATGALNTQSRDALKQSRDALQASLESYKAGRSGFGYTNPGAVWDQITGSAGKAKTALEEVNAALHRGTGVPLSGYLGPLIDGLDGIQAKYHEVSKAAADFTRQVTRANNVLDQRGTIRDYQASLDDFTKAVKDNGKTLDITTEKGRNVQGALDGIASTALKAATSMKPLNQKHFMVQARADFVDAAEKLGKTHAQATALADRLGLLGKVKAKPTVTLQGMGQLNDNLNELNSHLNLIDHLRPTPVVSVAGVPSAISQVASLRYQIDQLHNKTVFVGVVRGGTQVGTNADGNIHDYYANGGMLPKIGDQQPQVRAYSGPAGLTWSEEGSGPWEAFISGHPGKIDRSRAIASEVIARLGGTAMFANGGMMGRGGSSSTERVVERVIVERLADRVTLVDKNGAIGEFAVRAARSEISDDQGYRATLARQGVG